MARHKKDAETLRLLAEMDATRRELLAVVDGLGEQGVGRGEIAKAAGWNPGYLTEFLTKQDKKPTTAKLVELIEALGAFLGAGRQPPGIAGNLETVARRYGRSLVQPANPAVGPVPVNAPNWVRRPDIDDAVTRSVPFNGNYAVDGQPMTGVSSVLLQVESQLRERGFEVCRISAGHDLADSGALERSKTGVLGALAGAIMRSEEPLGLDFYSVQDAIVDHLSGAEAGFALILDDVNRLPDTSLESVKLLLRDWGTKRAVGEPAFANTTVWVAYTSNVRNASLRSQFIADYIITRWFLREEVRLLAEALAPAAAATGLISAPRRWATSAAAAAWGLFEGQPQLVHCYLWDRHNDGLAHDADGIERTLVTPPEGAYRRHLDRIARSLILELTKARAETLMARLADAGTIGGSSASAGAAGDSITNAERQAAERLGVVTPSGAWRCAYYKAHLQTAVEQQEVKASPEVES
jgi:hypothetical protein